MARCMDQLIVIICAYFITSPKEFILLAKIPTSLAGIFPSNSNIISQQQKNFKHLKLIFIFSQVEKEFGVWQFMHFQQIFLLPKIVPSDLECYFCQGCSLVLFLPQLEPNYLAQGSSINHADIFLVFLTPLNYPFVETFTKEE